MAHRTPIADESHKSIPAHPWGWDIGTESNSVSYTPVVSASTKITCSSHTVNFDPFAPGTHSRTSVESFEYKRIVLHSQAWFEAAKPF
jgi:hypothetical protein